MYFDDREVREMAERGRDLLGRGAVSEIEGRAYIPGSVLVATSVSTVFVRSTIPSRFIGSFAPSTIIPFGLELIGKERGVFGSIAGIIVLVVDIVGGLCLTVLVETFLKCGLGLTVLLEVFLLWEEGGTGGGSFNTRRACPGVDVALVDAVEGRVEVVVIKEKALPLPSLPLVVGERSGSPFSLA